MFWGCSSVGRAPALQAGGQEFDSPHLHQKKDIQWMSQTTDKPTIFRWVCVVYIRFLIFMDLMSC